MASVAQIAMHLTQVSTKVQQQRYLEALRIIRETKILDLSNVYLSSIEQFVSRLSTEYKNADPRVLERLIDLANEDSLKRREEDEALENVSYLTILAKEKIKNMYFDYADALFEAKDYQRALEEVRRVLMIESENVIAKQYEEKLQEMISFSK